MKRLSSIKQYMKKPAVWAICAALLVGSVAGTVGTLAFTKDTKLETAKPAQTAGTVTATTDDTKTVDKDETVYVLAGADGTVQKIIVSDWIKMPSAAPRSPMWARSAMCRMSRATKATP